MRAALAAALAALLIVVAAALSLTQPYKGFPLDVVTEIPLGTASRDTAGLLAEKGIVRYRWQFLLARVLRPRARLQAGEYRFAKPASVWEVFDRLVRGDVIHYELAIPEGFNVFDIARSVEQLGFVSAREFLEAARDTSLIAGLAPAAPTLEGYLFPSTYHVSRSTTAAQLCRLMTDNFRKQWNSLHPRAPAHQTVTLASLIEKETSVAAERELVASVYSNRLRLGMKLECDPTTIYSAELVGRWRGAIHKSDLERDHPYNTYIRAGLPPGPIANPGLAALKAALTPAQTNYLFFVAKPGPSGEHRFSTDLAGHRRAVSDYRRGERQTRSRSAKVAGLDTGKRRTANR